MIVTKQWLEKKVKELNDCLLDNEKKDFFVVYSNEKKKRNYYVEKLIELETNQLQTIKV
jgi:hypothetical protein